VNTEHTEQRLRAALAARVEQIQEQDLRPASLPGTAPRGRASRTRRGAAWRQPVLVMGAAAAVIVVSAVAVDVVGRNRDSGPATVTSSAPASVRFITRSQTLAGTTADATYPVPEVTGGAPGVAARADEALTRRVDELVEAFRTQVLAPEMPTENLLLEVTADTVETWRQYLSVRFDQIANFGGARPTNSSAAVVIDTRTGSAVTADQVFTDIEAVDRLMRQQITTEVGAGAYPDAIATLTMRPGTSAGTAPLTWYPASDGLHWVVDRDAIAAGAIGQPDAVLPWSQLTRFVRAAPTG
jgi:hypothetical protein